MRTLPTLRYHYYVRDSEHADWALTANAPGSIKDRLHSGRVVKHDGQEWRALPRLPTNAEITAAAYRLSQEIAKARRDSDWTHPANMLAIEAAHDAFRCMLSDRLEELPPLVDVPTRKRWKPR